MYTVYIHINKFNEKRYVGITKQKPENRWGINGCNYKESPHFMFAIKKYGWDNFEHKILAEGLSKQEACNMEMVLIKEWELQDRRYGYNILEGGEAPSMPQEVKDKIAKALIGNKNGEGIPCSEEKKKQLSNSYPNKRPIYCLELDKVFESVQSCAKELGISATNITKLCNGRGKTLKGFHLKYYDTTNA